MLPNTGNIFAQLLGGFDSAASTSNEVGGQSSGGPAFGSILAGALGSTGSTGKAGSAPGNPQLMGIPLSMFGQMLVGLGADDTGLLEAAGDQVATGTGDMPGASLVEQGASSDKTADDGNLLKPEFTISNQRLQALMAMASKQADANLSDGIYNVLDQAVNGDNLDLTLMPEDSSEPIKISIPLELLARDAASLRIQGVLNAANRVALKGQEHHNAAALSKLFTDLKLKTLEVKLEPSVQADGQTAQPVQFKLVAENAGHQVLIRSKLLLSQVKAGAVTPQDDSQMPVTEAEPEADGTPGAKFDLNGAPMKGHLAARPVHQTSAASRFDLADRLSQPNQTSLDDTLVASESAASGHEQLHAISHEAAKSSHIKLTLPDNLTSQLRPNGQSILIRIEPEHLGPARLNLSMNHHGLTARVSVDTIAAKTVVEHSLDQLTEQLSRAGIHVDRIEVSLTGGDARERFFERRPLWMNQQNDHRPFDDDDFDENRVTTLRPLPAQLRQYVEAGRVNLWA